MAKIINKINWIITGLLLQGLKKGLQKRVQNGNKDFLSLSKNSPTSICNRIDFIVDECKNKKLLHVGFTDFPFTTQKLKNNSLLHILLKSKTANLIGVDIEEAAIHEYASFTNDPNVFFADITKQYPIAAIEFLPDIILLGEVLEHLKNPHQAVELLHRTFNAGTKILVTVPNYTALNSIGASLNKTELIHPDHYWYFSPYTLCKLFDAQFFNIEQMQFGMYYQYTKKINIVMRTFPYNGDCIMAIFSIKK